MRRKESRPESGHEAGTIREQLLRLRRQVEEAEAGLIDREAELADLRIELSAFRLEYDTRVGRKVAELEEIEAELKRCRERVQHYRQWGPGGPPRTRAGTTYVPVEEQFRRTWRQPESAAGMPDPALRAGAPRPAGGELAANEARVKKLYRQLCRRFHPDLTQDPAERERRTEIMAAVNVAYSGRTRDVQRSLAELEALAEKDVRAPGEQAGTDEQRLAALREKLDQIRRRLGQVEREFRELMDSPTMRMSLEVRLAARRGRDLLAEMAADVDKELLPRQAELDFLLAQLRQLGLDD